VECAEIRSLFVAGSIPAGPRVDAHLKVCPHCRELFEKGAQLGRRLAVGVVPNVEPGDLFALVEKDVKAEVGVRARLRALSTPTRALVLLVVAALPMLGHLLFDRRADFGEYSPGLFWGVALLFGAGLAVGIRSLLRGVAAPLRSPWRGRGLALGLLLVPGVAALLAPLGAGSPEAVHVLGSPSSCFTWGAAFVVPLVVAYWLFERRDSVPARTLVAAGALAGLAANLLLHAHCGSASPLHLLLGHASIGVVWAVALRIALGSGSTQSR
jgi:hypothetical protein